MLLSTTIGIGVSSSTEFDYQSFGGNISFSQKTRDRNGEHTAADEFYTSNYDLSKFDSSFFGMGMKFTPLNGIFGLKHWNTLEIRYGHYTRTTNMTSDIISINIKYK